MNGHAHLATGLLAGSALAATPPLSSTLEGGAVVYAAFVAAVGGAALWSDLDQPGGATAKLTWGPVTGALAGVVALLSGGHRGRSHDLLLAPLAVALLALGAVALASRPETATAGAVAVAALLALAVGCVLRGLDWLIPGELERTWPINLAVSAAAGAGFVLAVDPSPSWLPLALATGVAVHIAGDAFTTAGVPVPLSRSKRWGPRLLGSGSRVEVVVTALSLVGVAAFAWLRYR